MTIIKRSVKGTALTYSELDENFRDLDSDMTIDRVLKNGDSSSRALKVGTLSVTGGITIAGGDITFTGAIGDNTSHGYLSNGRHGPPNANTLTAERFSFATDAGDTAIGDASVQARRKSAGTGSSTHGYNAGGTNNSANPSLTIDKFTFAAITSATDVGDLIAGRGNIGANGQQSLTHGYNGGGLSAQGTHNSINTIEKYPYSSDTNSTDVGNLTTGKSQVGGNSSRTHGYITGGFIPNSTRAIEKYPFAVDANSTDIGNLETVPSNPGIFAASSQSSAIHGYSVSGVDQSPGATLMNDINRFPFASDTNGAIVGAIGATRYHSAGVSSEIAGYSAGGVSAPGAVVAEKYRFPFAEEGVNIADVASMELGMRGASGTQG